MPDLHDEVPGADEYRALRRAAGLDARSEIAARKGLAASLFAVTLREGDRLVGMGRIVGDGGCFAQVVDIAVDPNWQGRGFGKRIVARLSEWCAANLPPTCYVSLIADPPADRLYAQFGFDYAVGMGRTIR